MVDENRIRTVIRYSSAGAAGFVLGVIFALSYILGYDFFATYKNMELRLGQELTVANAEGRQLSFPPGTVLFWERSFDGNDFLLVRVSTDRIREIAAPVDDQPGASFYWKRRP